MVLNDDYEFFKERIVWCEQILEKFPKDCNREAKLDKFKLEQYYRDCKIARRQLEISFEKVLTQERRLEIMMFCRSIRYKNFSYIEKYI